MAQVPLMNCLGIETNDLKQDKSSPSALPMGLAAYLILLHLTAALVKRGVDRVEILAVEIVLRDAEGVGNTVNMKYYVNQVFLSQHFRFR